MTGQVSALTREIIDRVYPVHVILDFAAEVDPNIVIGCGTVWTRISDGRALIASSTARPVGWTGGSETVTLTEAQLPHITGQIRDIASQSQNIPVSASGAFTASLSGSGNGIATTYADPATRDMITMSFGQDQPHDNLPPSRAVCRWERTA